MRFLVSSRSVVSLALALSLGGLPARSAPPTGWDMADMDRGCAACQDFYRYANGGWLDRNSIPADRSRWSTYDEVAARNRRELMAILAEARAAAAAGEQTTKAKIGLFYATCLDEARTEADGLSPVTADLQALDRLSSRAGLQGAITRTKLAAPDLLFWADVDADPAGSGRNILKAQQAGLSLSDASLYLDDTEEAKAAREQLTRAVERLSVLSGSTPAAAAEDARRVLSLETELARGSSSEVDKRDPKANYHPMTGAQATAGVTPHWDWSAYMASIGAAPGAIVSVEQPGFFSAFDRLLAERPLEDWRAYLKWKTLKQAAPWLSRDIAGAAFAFDAATTGVKAQQPREERCLGAVNDYLGQGLGRLYLERTFTPQARARADEMIANLKVAMANRVRSLSWMSEPTRREALAKLQAAKIYVGGPDRWIDYSGFRPENGPFLANVRRAAAFETVRYGRQLGGPVDRGSWYMLPQDASGGADHARNTFIYPAGKFQAPFFDPLADDALNYGSLGATMGHELVHLFDDRGRQYDAKGALRDWWTAEDAGHFKAQAAVLSAQFDGYTVEGQPVNGALTLSENIADLGGLTVAYDALEKAMAGRPRPLIDGFTPEQRFFLAWARNFRTLMRPERARTALRTDVHGPNMWRVNGPLSDMPEFRRAFGCREGEPMARTQPVMLW